MEYYKPAGLFKRIIAWGIDYFLLVLFGQILFEAIPIYAFQGLIAFGMFFYFFMKDGLYNGQSLGKLILGLKVVDFKDQTKPCDLTQSIKRNLISPFFYSLIVALIVAWQIEKNQNRRRWGDGFANTMVVDLSKKAEASIKPTEKEKESVFGNEIWENKKEKKEIQTEKPDTKTKESPLKKMLLYISVFGVILFFLVIFATVIGFVMNMNNDSDSSIEPEGNNYAATNEIYSANNLPSSDFEVEGNKYSNQTIVFENKLESDFEVGIEEIRGFEAIVILKGEQGFVLTGATDFIEYDTDDKRKDVFDKTVEEYCGGVARGEGEGSSAENCLYNINTFVTVEKSEKVKQGWLIEKVSEIPFEDGEEVYVSLTVVFDGKNKAFILSSSGNNLFKQEIEETKKTILENTSFLE